MLHNRPHRNDGTLAHEQGNLVDWRIRLDIPAAPVLFPTPEIHPVRTFRQIYGPCLFHTLQSHGIFIIVHRTGHGTHQKSRTKHEFVFDVVHTGVVRKIESQQPAHGIAFLRDLPGQRIYIRYQAVT